MATLMRHLKPAEIVDAVEGALCAERREHVATCAECQTLVQEAAATLEAVRTVDAPEPSPLYWDHLSAQIAERIDAEPASAPRWRAWLWAPATALAASIGIAFVLSNRPAESPSPVTTESARGLVAEPVNSAIDEDSWTLISEVTDDLAWEDAEAAGLGVGPGSAEHAMMQLSDDQQQELAELLRNELSRLKS